MSKKLIGACLVCLALALPASVVVAQDGVKAVKTAEKKSDKKITKEKAPPAKPFVSPKGYSITPPAGWNIASAYMTEEQLAELPSSVREQFHPEQIDVLFMDSSPQKVGSSFGDNLNVVVVAEKIPLDEATVKELKAALLAQYTQVFEGFKMNEFKVVKLKSGPALLVKGSYTLSGHNLRLQQFFVTGDTSSLVVTCTMDEARVVPRAEACQAAADTVIFKK
jgi:hypothetical protein